VQDPCGVLHDATSGERAPDMPLLFGEDAAVRSAGLEERGLPRGQRVLDAVSKVRVGGRSLAAMEIAWFEIGVRSNPEITTYSIATTSPSHRDRSQQVVLSRVSQIQTYLPPRAVLGFRRADLRGSLLFNVSETGMPHREKFRRRIPIPISLWVTTQQSPGKHRQRAHRRRFARPPRF
jgi:hypothetical protein